MIKRIDNPSKLDVAFIDEAIKSGEHIIVQFSEKNYTDETLDHLNELCGKYVAGFAVRFYGFYFQRFDFNDLLKIPNVKHLYADCLRQAKNISALRELTHLKELSLGVYELEDTEILRYDNFKQLRALDMGDAKTKALNLKYLEYFTELKSLGIVGHNKNINSIKKLSTLENLWLHSLKNTPLDFVNSLKRLKTLDLFLGGRENIREIGENGIEELKIVRVRGFAEIGNISNFRKLKKLWFEDNIKLLSIGFERKFETLEELLIYNCKTLSTIKGLENLTALRELKLYKTALELDDIKSKLPKTLKNFVFEGKSVL